MSLLGFALRNLIGNGFRSLVVSLCVMLAVAFTLAGTVVVRGAEAGLRVTSQRLGADIIVVPETTRATLNTALLLGAGDGATLPAEALARVAAVPGVAAVSPQLYLGTLPHLAGALHPAFDLVAFDPATDFAIQSWLADEVRSLGQGEALAGSEIGAHGGEVVEIGGYTLLARGELEPTGTALDQALFVSFETAESMREELGRLDPPLIVPASAYSAVLVRLHPEADDQATAPLILQAVPGALPVESPGIFRALQAQMAGLARTALAMLVAIWAVALIVVGLVFLLSAEERRREVAVLRALGASRRLVLASLLLEAALVAALGAALGAALASCALYLGRDAVEGRLGIPFLFPSPGELLALVAAGVSLALIGGALAALGPALRAASLEPAEVMRE